MSEIKKSDTRRDIEYLEKRLGDLKWYMVLFSSIIPILITGVVIIGGINLASEKNSLKEYKESLRDEIRSTLGTVSSKADIVIELPERTALNSSVVKGYIWRDSLNNIWVSFRDVYRNKGNGRSGPIFTKLYSSDLHFDNIDIDNNGYKYEAFVTCDKLDPGELLGGVSIPYRMNVQVSEVPQNLDKDMSILIVVFYGNGEKSQLEFKIHLQNSPMPQHS
jgi:hypothetical protein